MATGLLRLALCVAVATFGFAQAEAREVTHAMGTTTVPDAPQRILVLTNEGTEALLDLGIKPHGAVRSIVGDPWYPHIAAAMTDVIELGNEDEPNLELIASLEPDLIIGIKVRHEGIYQQLSAVAPTVMSNVFDGTWRQNYQLYAEAVGRDAVAAEHLAAFDTRIAALRASLGDRLAEEVSLVRFRAGGRTSIRAKSSFAGIILSDMGFARPAAQARLTDSEEITRERTSEMDGDRIFYFTREAGDGEGLAAEAEWMQEPLWLSLKAVKAGNIHRVDDAVWNISGGILAANLVLDDIAAVYGVPSAR